MPRDIPQDTDWTPAQRIALRGFLNTHGNLIAVLRARIPKIDGINIEARAIAGSEHKGAEALIDVLLSLSQDMPNNPPQASFIPQ